MYKDALSWLGEGSCTLLTMKVARNRFTRPIGESNYRVATGALHLNITSLRSAILSTRSEKSRARDAQLLVGSVP